MGTPTLEGVAQLTRQLQALGKLDDGKALKRCVKAGINVALARAIETCPVGTEIHRLGLSKRLKSIGIKGNTVGPGFAKASLRTISTINAQKNIASGLLGVRKAAYYVLQFVELGTRYQKAQPFLRNALLTTRDEVETKLRESLQKDVLKAAATP
jgi:HK97 gp10 family phage protein